jgi:hypothetical protein
MRLGFNAWPKPWRRIRVAALSACSVADAYWTTKIWDEFRIASHKNLFLIHIFT